MPRARATLLFYARDDCAADPD
eukprot:COSAG01_NODE_41973_length_445_cov_0.563584_1_plen_21_part_10